MGGSWKPKKPKKDCLTACEIEEGVVVLRCVVDKSGCYWGN